MAEFNEIIQKLLEIQNREQDRSFSREELREIALGLGITGEMWDRIQKEADDQIVRGAGFLRYKNWTDAIEEFEQAALFRPDDMEVLSGLARSYAGRWRKTGDAADREKALAFAEKCLGLDPGHDPSLQLISQVRAGRAVGKGKKSPLPWIALGAVLVLAVVLFVLLVFQSPDTTGPSPAVSEPSPVMAEPAPPRTDQPAVNAPPPALNQPPRKAAEVIAAGPEESGLLDDLPVKFVAGQRSEGLTLYPEWARYTRYDEAYSLTVAADITSAGVEIEELKLRLEFIGADGRAVHFDEKEAWAKWRPVIRPGDVMPFDYLEYVESNEFPDIREVRVSAASVMKRPAPAEYEPGRPVELIWDNKPANFDLEARERQSTVRQGFIGRKDDMTHVLALELVNTGRVAISGLTLRLEYPDGRGGTLGSHKAIVNLDSYPRFKPGQRRVFGTHAPIKNASPEDFKGYKVYVQTVD